MEESYHNIFKYSRTIEELKGTTNSDILDNNYKLREWRNVRTLLNDDHFNTMLYHMGIKKIRIFC